MKKIINLLLFLLLVGILFPSLSSAGVVPGTIQKGGYTTGSSCNTSTNSYSPSGGYCNPRYCKVYEYAGACGNGVPDSMNCGGTGGTPDTMNCAAGDAVPDTMNCGGSGGTPDTMNCAAGDAVPDTMNCAGPSSGVWQRDGHEPGNKCTAIGLACTTVGEHRLCGGNNGTPGEIIDPIMIVCVGPPPAMNAPCGNAKPDSMNAACGNAVPGGGGTSACGNAKPDSMNAACGNATSPASGTGACGNSVPDSMNCLSGCATYYYDPVTTGTLTFTNYFYKNDNPTFGDSGYSQKLGQDVSESCNRQTNGTPHTPATLGGILSCADGSDSFYIGGSSGVCNFAQKTDNCVTYFNQLGSLNRGVNGCDTSGSANSAHPAVASCTTEGRYATPDSGGPTVSINNVSNVFDGDVNNWCNLAKYRSSGYGSSASPELLGCTYYKNKIGHTNMGPSGKNPDLLEGMELVIDDLSGISDIKIEMGASCTATYTLGNDLSSVIVSSTSANGVKPGYRNITLYYNATSTNNGGGAPGAGLPSLLTAFGKTRLDECLTEGKNFLRVTVRDNARSDFDGIAFTPNTNTVDYGSMGKFIKVDNTAPKLELTGLARNIAYSNNPVECFIGGVVNESGSGKEWKNFSIKGTLKSGDKFGNDSSDPCAPGVLTSGTGGGSPPVSCSGTLPANSIKTTTADTASSYTYSATPTAACTFSCQPGFSWNGSACNPTVTCGPAHGRSYTSSGSIPTADLCADTIGRTIGTTSSQYIWSCDVGVSCSAVKETATCATQPNYTHATFTVGTPNVVNQAWQDSNSANACYYVCKDGYTGSDCSVPPSCIDGIQNQDETGVDTGGVCAPKLCADIGPKISWENDGTWEGGQANACWDYANGCINKKDGDKCLFSSPTIHIGTMELECQNGNWVVLNANCDQIVAELSCAGQPNYTHATFTVGTPNAVNTAWQNSNSTNACYYACTDGYSGNDCSVPPSNCATQPSYTHATFTVGTPNLVNQAWVKNATSCGFTCTDGYSGNNCEIAPGGNCNPGEIEIGICITGVNTGEGSCKGMADTYTLANPGSTCSYDIAGKSDSEGVSVCCIPPPSYSCATQPNYTHAAFTVGTPNAVNTAWQNTNPANACHYVCKDGYTGNDCSVPPTYSCTGSVPSSHVAKSNDTGLTANAVWQNSVSTNACYYTCTDGYTGNDCSVPPSNCTTQPNYTHATFTVGTPNAVNQAWQNNNSANACYYACKDGYSGNDCSVPPIVQCGSANGGNYYNSTEINTNNLCSDGLVRSVTTLGSQFSWSCDTGVSCSAYVKKDGACDNTTLFACSNDTLSVTNSGGTCGGTATWGCNGVNGGTNTLSNACSKQNESCPPPNACATQPDYTHATFTVGTPNLVNQAWIKNAANCGFTCTDGYSGDDCSVAPSCSDGIQNQDETGVDTGGVCTVYTYQWQVSGFGDCSKSCGGGTQTQTVICKRNDDVTMNDSFCTEVKPEAVQSCNIQACPPGLKMPINVNNPNLRIATWLPRHTDNHGWPKNVPLQGDSTSATQWCTEINYDFLISQSTWQYTGCGDERVISYSSNWDYLSGCNYYGLITTSLVCADAQWKRTPTGPWEETEDYCKFNKTEDGHYQTRPQTVVCEDTGGNSVEDKYCYGTKPGPLEKECIEGLSQ